MPSGLKNAGATYMRAMTTVFHNMMHKEIEVYVVYVVVKSRVGEDHLEHLRSFFDRLRKYDLKLNPAKCAFGVPAEKLLGFIVSRRGIELDPTNIKAIQELPPPRTKKEYVAQKAVKGQALVDLLARSPVDDNPVPLWTYFPDEEIMTIEGEESEDKSGWKVYFDGAVNFKGSGIEAILVSDSGQYYPVAAKLNFNCTNNMDEYEACILGLRLALNMDVKDH
ncbi:uncharacterized protein LOC132613537 [Lycium barbarum]|uniref:uncharacterized protein LOC132613537 n=1 Tax=Lycium barbarum TaxID=112863 RepID=UPI00293F5F76|nr:uncharacterized protein LOC132613537 [Lycium barbarum]